jgi:hypothetical protein
VNLFRVTITFRDDSPDVVLYVTHIGDSYEATQEKVRPMLAQLGIDELGLKQIRVAEITTAELGVSK